MIRTRKTTTQPPGLDIQEALRIHDVVTQKTGLAWSVWSRTPCSAYPDETGSPWCVSAAPRAALNRRA